MTVVQLAFVGLPPTVKLLVALQTPPVAAAGFGVSLLAMLSLFGAPTICVVSVADVPAIDELLVVMTMRQLPGVLVAWSVKATTPLAAVACPLPAEKLDPVPVGTPVMLQMLAEPESRVAVSTVELSVKTVLPFASLILTVSVEVEIESAAIGFRLNDAVVFVAVPGEVVVAVALQPVRVPPETET